MTHPQNLNLGDQSHEVEPYEAPRVESVMTAEKLAREVKYAGETSSLPDSND